MRIACILSHVLISYFGSPICLYILNFSQVFPISLFLTLSFIFSLTYPFSGVLNGYSHFIFSLAFLSINSSPRGILSCLVLSCLVLSCLVLSCLVLFLSYLILSCLVLSFVVLAYRTYVLRIVTRKVQGIWGY